MTIEKTNIQKFDEDVNSNTGYIYTTNARLSSFLANKRISEEVIKILPVTTTSIIDVGCGDGTYTSELKKINEKINIIGIDPSKNAIEAAIKNFPDITFLIMNLYNKDEIIKLPKVQYSVIRGVLHHVSDPYAAIGIVASFSEKMVIMEPNGNNFILKLIEKNSKYHIEHEEQSFSSKQLTTWCIKSGWKIEQITYIGFVPFFFPKYLSKIIYFFQPLLERIPLINKYLSAQIVLHCSK